jgi:hypothetical protein
MPGPCCGAPNTVTFRRDVPSFTFDCAGKGGRSHNTRRSGHPSQLSLGKRRGTQERPGRTGLDHESVHADGINGSLRLDPKAVRKPGHYERHREDQAGAQDRDDEAPTSPLHVPQRRKQHGPEATAVDPFLGRVFFQRVAIAATTSLAVRTVA